MEGNNIRIILTGILASVFIAFRCPFFLHGDGMHVALSYHFFHANVVHLLTNSLSLWTLFRKGQRYSISALAIAFVIGTASWFCTSADVVGFSNVIFAIIGLRTPSLKSAWWRHPSVITFFVITILMAFLPQVSAVTHVVSFLLGCIVAGAQRTIKRISLDFSRASYSK